MTHSGIGTGVRAHIADASQHLRFAHKSLNQAADQAATERDSRKLTRLAETVQTWACELDPKTHQARERARRAA